MKGIQLVFTGTCLALVCGAASNAVWADEHCARTGEQLESSKTFHPASTNELNCREQVPGREGQTVPYVVQLDSSSGKVKLKFTNDTNSQAFFEYRIDGETTGSTGHFIVNTSYNHPTTGLPALIDDVIHFGVNVDGRNVSDAVIVEQEFPVSSVLEIRLALGGERDWDFDWTAFYAPAPTYSCVGFKSPADRDVQVNRPNRVVPLRMELQDEYDGYIGYLESPPVLQATFEDSSSDPGNLDDLDTAGRGDEGNTFAFDGTGWAFNLSTRGLAKGTYTLSAVSGDESEYIIDPTCEVKLVIR